MINGVNNRHWNMEKNRISVIVPAYNAEKYIERCLDSIINQTYKNIEVIVIDDGSSDTTGNILDQYTVKHGQIVVLHKQNGGVSSARMAGVEMATGEYIGFVDSDDYIEPDMYSKLLKNALDNKAQISHCGYRMVFPDGHEDFYYNTGKKMILNNRDGLKELIKGDIIEPGLWNKLYHASVVQSFQNSPVWGSQIKINEGLLMNYILFKNTEISVFEDIPLYHYILRPGSAATSKSIHKIVDPLRVMELIKNDVTDSDLISLAYERYLRVLISNANQNSFIAVARESMKKLKREINTDSFRDKSISAKIKVMAIGTVYTKHLYKAARFIYDTFKGNRKKYDIN